jgi:hypothetical protein
VQVEKDSMVRPLPYALTANELKLSRQQRRQQQRFQTSQLATHLMHSKHSSFDMIENLLFEVSNETITKSDTE